MFRSQVFDEEDTDNFHYYDYKGDITEDSFKNYINGVSNLCSYNDLGSVSYGDSLLELVTCEYHVNNGRLVVLCRLEE